MPGSLAKMLLPCLAACGSTAVPLAPSSASLTDAGLVDAGRALAVVAADAEPVHVAASVDAAPDADGSDAGTHGSGPEAGIDSSDSEAGAPVTIADAAAACPPPRGTGVTQTSDPSFGDRFLASWRRCGSEPSNATCSPVRITLDGSGCVAEIRVVGEVSAGEETFLACVHEDLQDVCIPCDADRELSFFESCTL